MIHVRPPRERPATASSDIETKPVHDEDKKPSTSSKEAFATRLQEKFFSSSEGTATPSTTSTTTIPTITTTKATPTSSPVKAQPVATKTPSAPATPKSPRRESAKGKEK